MCCNKFLCTLLRLFITNEWWTLSNTLFAFTETIMLFLSFILFRWSNRLICMCMLNHPCITGINNSWSWCIIFFDALFNSFASILYRIFASQKLNRNIDLYFSYSWNYSYSFGIRVMFAVSNEFGNVPSSIFWKGLWIGINPSLNDWWNSPV